MLEECLLALHPVGAMSHLTNYNKCASLVECEIVV
jgi:hypothetical protein